MERITDIQILCLNRDCVKWFDSPVFVDDMDLLMSANFFGNEAQCPSCGKMTPCNKENMRVKSENGGFRGLDTF